MAANETRARANGRSAPDAPSARDLLAHGERLRSELNTLGDVARGALADWEMLLRGRLEQQPYATLAVAAGVGYVLGGGVPPTVVRVLLGVGGRLAIERFLTRVAASDARPSASREAP